MTDAAENSTGHPVVLFDGDCGLCDRSVRFVVRHDPQGIFRLASLQSEAGRSLLEQHAIDPTVTDSVVLVEDGQAYVRSAAAWRIASRLTRPWRWLSWSRIIPRPLRDLLYRFVARMRYRVFGRKDVCATAPPDLRERLLS